MEKWKAIEGYEGFYEVSDQGRVRGLDREVDRGAYGVQKISGRIIKPNYRRDGYQTVHLRKVGERKAPTIHSLVAAAFIGPRPEGHDICHNDGTRTNNSVENLRYGTRSENILDAVGHETHRNARSTECKLGHSLGGENSISRDRECLACCRANATVRYHTDLTPFHKEVADLHLENINGEKKRMLRADFDNMLISKGLI